MQEPRFPLRLERQPVVEQSAELLVAFSDRLAKAQIPFCLECEPPQAFVQHVDRDAAFSGFESITSVASIEPGATDALEKLSVGATQSSGVAS